MAGDYRKDPEAIARLDDRQYAVTQEAATEPAFDNEFWDKKEAGIYVDIVSGNRSSPPSRNSTAVAGGPASPFRSSPPTWWRRWTRATE